jgi:hypothetical protein
MQTISKGEVCAVKRSDGKFKYGRVDTKDATSVVICVDSSGSTKPFVATQVVDPQLLKKLVPRAEDKNGAQSLRSHHVGIR